MGRSVIAAEKGSKEGEIVIFTLIGLQGQMLELRVIEIKTFGLGYRIWDMALWDEPSVECALTYYSVFDS